MTHHFQIRQIIGWQLKPARCFPRKRAALIQTGMLTSTDPYSQYTATIPAVRPKQHDDYWSSAASIGFEQDIAISRLSKLNGA